MILKNHKSNFNILDSLLILSILLCISGYLLARAEKTGLNNVIEGRENIAIEVFIPDVYSDDLDKNNGFFKPGEKAAITIRNRPYTQLSIIKIDSRPKQIVLPNLSGSHKIINDPTKQFIQDYFVTLSDTALKTKDGYAIGGNKIKAGNQIELEGFNYRFNGKVINIYPLNE